MPSHRNHHHRSPGRHGSQKFQERAIREKRADKVATDPHVEDVIKPLARVVLEFTDGTVIEVNEGNIQREELFLVHSNYGLVALSLAVSTVGWKPNTADKVLIDPTPIVPNRTDKRRVITHTPLESGFGPAIKTIGQDMPKQEPKSDGISTQT